MLAKPAHCMHPPESLQHAALAAQEPVECMPWDFNTSAGAAEVIVDLPFTLQGRGLVRLH